MLPIEILTPQAFEPFGDVIPADGDERFVVAVTEPNEQGWRLARSRVGRGPVATLGRHETTREAFVPLTGTAVIVVAERETPENPRAFLLDQPVCLHKDVWHQTVAVSETAFLFIAENAEVGQDDVVLQQPLELGLAPRAPHAAAAPPAARRR